MNKLILALVAVACLALPVLSEEKAPRKHRTREEVRQHVARIKMKRTGGIVRKAGSASGCVVFLNAQKTVASGELKSSWESIEKALPLNIAAKDVAKVNVRNPSADIAAAGGKVGVVIVEEAGLPSLLAAPEEGWAIVNVVPLAADGSTNVAARVRKEILRAFGLAGGAAFMSMGPIVLRPDVVGVRDLDRIRHERLGEEALGACERALPFHGVTPWVETTYLRACEQGWAPAPTNEYQKAIWDKVHTIPTEPLKIKYQKPAGK